MMSVDTTIRSTERSYPEAPPAVQFSLGVGEPTFAGLRRILVEQVELGSWHLERARLSDLHVHEVRKTTKRVRSVLRMLSDDISPTDYTLLNVEVRDLARELSQIRSAVVRVDLLGSLVVDDVQLTADTRELHGELMAAADKQRDGLEESRLRNLLARFAAVRVTIEDVQFPDTHKASLDGVRKTYRRGRRSMTHAYGDPTIENFHAWRKQVKYLRHQMEILELCGGPAVSRLASDLEVIGEELGMDHDLADLDRATDSVPSGVLSWASRGLLNDLIGTTRAGLELRLKPIAERVYAAKPEAFAERVIPRSF